MMKKQKYENLFNPSSIAIVGASNKQGKVGTVITENITKLGFKGKIYFVNSSYKILKFKKCYPTLDAIEKSIDCAIVAVPARFVAQVVRDGSKNVKNFVVISAGFSEIGAQGKKLEKELEKIAKEKKVNILGPNCLGFINPFARLNASFAGGMPSEGNIAFVSQSGALAVALADRAKNEQIGFSHIISVGNKMQLDEAELLEFLACDKNTKVIGMYLEGIRNGKKFLAVAERVSKIKPIIILKAGKTEKSQKAISSHTGALAGSDEIMDIAFEKCGVIRAIDLAEFFDLLNLISFTDSLKDNRVAVITNAGGAGVLTTDAFLKKEIVLADFNEKFKKTLGQFLPAEGSVENPIDLLGDAMENRYRETFEKIRKEKVGAVIAILTPQQQTPVLKIAQEIIAFKNSTKQLVISIFIGGEKIKEAILFLKKNGVPNFGNPDSAIRALDKYYRWTIFSKKKKRLNFSSLNLERKQKNEEIINNAKRQGRSALFFAEAAEIMKSYGIMSGEYFVVLAGKKIPELENFPVVLKIDDDKVLHKSDKQALILNIQNQQELLAAVSKLKKAFPTSQMLIQTMQTKQVEIILGIKLDPIFGPVIVYGLGGIYTEVFKMVDFMLLPVSRENIAENILKSKLKFLFTGERGQKAYNLEEFTRTILGLVEFATECKNISEFDINPLFIYNDGTIALAVDIKIII
jgi:acetyltransferase